jgi:septal ring factor EnvC (AmiA/AmiB activator)
VTFTEAWDLIGQSGSPVVVGIFIALVFLQLFSERVSKALGPLLGAVGRWWHGREERQERQLQAELAAREETLGRRASFQLEDMERQLRYFAEQMERFRTQAASREGELTAVHRLLDATRRELGATQQELEAARRELRELKNRVDTGERLALLPPPPPVRRPDDGDDTARIYP